MVCQRNLNCVHYMGAFHSLKYLRPYKTRANGTEISWKVSRKYMKMVQFLIYRPFHRKFLKCQMKWKCSVRNLQKKNWIYPSRLSRLFFYKLWKMLFQLSLKIFRNWNRNFCQIKSGPHWPVQLFNSGSNILAIYSMVK